MRAHAGLSLTLPHLHAGRAALRRQAGRHRDGGGQAQTETYGEWAERTVGWAGSSTRSASRPTAAWAPSGGTPPGTSSSTSPRPAPTGSCALNIRLFPERLVYVASHAADEVVFVDKSLAKLVWPLFEKFDTVRHIVVMDDAHRRGARRRPARTSTTTRNCGATSPVAFDVRDENQAASMCCTSSTTGN